MEWSKDGKWIYGINRSKTPREIVIVSANTGQTKTVYILPSSKILTLDGVDISPNGNTIVCAIQETSSDIWMIENFDPDVE